MDTNDANDTRALRLARLRAKLLAIIHGEASHVCVPMQGSGTFSVEAAVNTLVPRDGHLLVLINGAYGKRLARLATMMGGDILVQSTPGVGSTFTATIAAGRPS